MTAILPNDVKVFRDTWDIAQPNKKPVEIGEAIFMNNLLDTIELLATELGAAIHVLRLRKTDITFTNPTLSAWVEWGVAKQQK